MSLRPHAAPLVVACVVSLLLAFGIRQELAREREWEGFRDHYCRPVGKVHATAVMPEPDKTRWLCDDGREYVR